MKKFYITTAIDYVNNLPHLGTAYEKVCADVIARYYRMEGWKVHFQMGSDEHSANVKKEAAKKGLSPLVYCNQMKEEFLAIWKSLNISLDGFIQTSEKRHHEAVKRLFDLILKKGDIYQSPYRGWYCESCEAFLLEKDLVDGNCAIHKLKPKWLEEENYFFRLSAYQERLLQHYRKHPEFILPEIRRNEVRRWVEGGLEDISISRASFDWGIPLPSDSKHVFYVWFDALINYLTATGFGQTRPARGLSLPTWPANLHVVGKDITRFHCVIWPAMLMSAGLPLPKTVFGHGFIYLKGEKMSKTLGNIITPLEIVPKYGADSLRYYLLRGSSFGYDGNFTWDDFIKRYNSDLANDLGNLLNRFLGMSHKYLAGSIKPAKTSPFKPLLQKTVQSVRQSFDFQKTGDFNFHLGLEKIWGLVHAGDKQIDTSAPWVLQKEGKIGEIQKVLGEVADLLRNIAILLRPFLPKTSEEIWRQLGLTLKWEKQSLKNVCANKTPSLKVLQGQPIFPRIEPSPLTPLPQRGEGTFTAGRGGTTGGGPPPARNEVSTAGGRGSDRTTAGIKESKMELDITEFQKLELRVAEVKQAEKVEGADRLLKLQVDLGDETRQIVAGIAQHYTPEQLIGKQVVIVTNLKPATIRGVESRGMLLAASDEGGLSIVIPEKERQAGAKVK